MGESISFWLVALGVPLVVVAGNSIVRMAAGLPQSAPADIVLALVVFDFAVVAQPKAFETYIRSPTFQEATIVIFGFLMIVGAFSWAIAVFVVEHKISHYWNVKVERKCSYANCKLKKAPAISFPYVAYFLSLFIPSIDTIGTIVPFVYAG